LGSEKIERIEVLKASGTRTRMPVTSQKVAWRQRSMDSTLFFTAFCFFFMAIQRSKNEMAGRLMDRRKATNRKNRLAM
jgi:hypothetical protein